MDSGLTICFEDDNCELLEWKVTDGSFVEADSVILVYRTLSGEEKRLKSPSAGVITVDTKVKRGKILSNEMVIARLEECKHAIVMKDMCGSCGKDLRERHGRAGERVEASTANISMIHHVPELIVSDELAQKLGNRDREVILKARKLVLLADLDQTLIHTTNTFNIENSSDVVHYKLKGTDFFTKLRPHTRKFLQEVSKLYEMHIISYGERQYAHRIAEILDPNRVYFGHRILSRDELLSAFHKTHNLSLLFPCGDQLITIIDDRPDVWEYSDALIQVKPYRFFKEVGDINAPCDSKDPVPSEKVDENSTEEGKDETLEHLARVLFKIHQAFYDYYDANTENRVLDVKRIIASMREKVLRGCSIVLSGIVPIGVDPTRTEAFRLCVQFGASVTDSITERTTHVIAARWGTSKVHEALKRKDVAIVNPKWLYACVERWEKVDEVQYELARESMSAVDKPLGGAVIVGDFSIGSLDQKTLRRMSDEVDEALSGESSESEKEDADNAVLPTGERERFIELGKRKSSEMDETQEKRRKVEEDEEASKGTNDAEVGSSSSYSESGSDFDDMAADVERQLLE